MTKEEAREKLKTEISVAMLRKHPASAEEANAILISMVTDRLSDLQLRVDELERTAGTRACICGHPAHASGECSAVSSTCLAAMPEGIGPARCGCSYHHGERT
jgi:hypothetical protein